MIHTKWSFILVMMLLASGTKAQDLTLDQLVDQSLKNNQQVQLSRLNEKQTDAQISEVKARARPQVNLTGDYKRYLKIPGQVVPASTFGGAEGSYQVLALGLPYNLSTSVQVSQALYSPSINIGLKAAKLSVDLASLQTLKTQEEVAFSVSNTYYNLQTVAQQMAFLRSNIASLDRLIQVTDLLYKNKLSQGIDVDRLRINRTQAQTQLESLQGSYQELINALKFLTGTPQTAPLSVKIDIDQNASVPTLIANDAINRTDILILERQKALNEQSTLNTKASFLPTLSAYGVANSTVFGKDGENSVLKNVPGYWLGLQLNWNIYDGSARKSKLVQQKIESQKLSIQSDQTKENISMDIANARTKFYVEQRNLTTSREQVALAEKVYTQTQLQFKEGTTALTEVIQAENAVQDAQNNYLNTLINLRAAELNWKKASGTIIPKQ
ncbi:TolC family protein [Arcicella rosea]|uniref:Outer membrane protein TolC n=1 Tax=Arcicella rosea TaxID=502909 RepID=A0A841EPA9_9BACT|nr:TolC family protein [Arcicella rosea]MBB6002863.1 outer membrane protein TolC [Arcicella rosea]